MKRILLALRKWREIRTVREAGHIAWMHHTQPWTRAYSIQRIGWKLYAVHRETARIAGRGRDVAALGSIILAHHQGRPMRTLSAECSADPDLAWLELAFGPVYALTAVTDGYLARRHDDGTVLLARSPGELRDRILADLTGDGHAGSGDQTRLDIPRARPYAEAPWRGDSR